MLAIQDRRSGQSNRPAAPVALQQRFCGGTHVEPLSDERYSDQAIWAVFSQRSPRRSGIAALISFLQANVS
jgi:hypothetical protein